MTAPISCAEMDQQDPKGVLDDAAADDDDDDCSLKW
jgi:hypothetical protein